MAHRARRLTVALALSVSIACCPLLSHAAPVIVPGPWYDQDKTNDASDPRWAYNYWDDGPGGNGVYDPGELWWNSIPEDPDHNGVEDPGENWGTKLGAGDMSCWAAAASNLFRYVTGRDRYMEWVYDGDWPDGSDYTWQTHGGTDKAIDTEGLPLIEVRNNDPGTPDGSWTGTGVIPYVEIRRRLEDRMPVSLGVTWHAATPGDVQHLITCYEIDAGADTITIADSDSDLGGGNEQRTYTYSYSAGRMTIDGYGAWINNFYYFDTNDWEGAGTGFDTNTAGITTEWNQPTNWADGAPSVSDFPKVKFLNAGEMNINGFAYGTRCIIQGGGSTWAAVNVNPGGQTNFRTLDVVQGRINVNGGTLWTRSDTICDGVIQLNTGSVHVGNLYVGSLGTGTFFVVGGNALVDDNTYVAHRAGSTGNLWVHGGSMSCGNLFVEAGGTVQVENPGTTFGADDFILNGTLQVGSIVPGPTVTAVIDFILGDTGPATATFTGSTFHVGSDIIAKEGTLTLTDTATRVGHHLLIDGEENPHVELYGTTMTLHEMQVGRAGRRLDGHLLLDEHAGTRSEIRTRGVNVDLYVGYAGRGIVTIQNGSIQRDNPAMDDIPNLTLGDGSLSYGKIELHSGSVWVDDLIIGREGSGEVDQHGGTVTAISPMQMGVESGSRATYDLRGGTLQVRGIERGDGSSTLNIDGGTLVLFSLPGETQEVGTLNIGSVSGTIGNYVLGSNSFRMDRLRVGYEGRGTLTLDHPDATLVVTTEMIVGDRHTGEVNQSDGSVTSMLDTYVGKSPFGPGDGTYRMTGGTLAFKNLSVGHDGAGLFNQSGSAVVNGMDLGVGSANGANDADYRLLGGNLTLTGDLELGVTSTGDGSFLLDGAATLLSTVNVHVGVEGAGTFAQVEGRHEVTGQLVLGSAGGSGEYHKSGGELGTASVVVGGDGTGLFVHTASTHVCTGDLTLGRDAGSTGIYGLGTHATLTVDGTVRVGLGGIGALEMDGGTLNGTGTVQVAAGSAITGNGRINLPIANEGQMTAEPGVHLQLWGGYSGTGTVEIQPFTILQLWESSTFDGHVTNNGDLHVQAGVTQLNAGMTGGRLFVGGGTLQINSAVTGDSVHCMAAATQSGNAVLTGSVQVDGTYDLTGAANLTDTGTMVQGDFTHSSSGTHHTEDVYIGAGMMPGTATYTLGTGTLEVKDLHVGGSFMYGDSPGELVVLDASARICVRGDLIEHPLGVISAPPGTIIHLTGSNVQNYCQDPSALADLANITFRFEGGPGVLDTFEVAGEAGGGVIDNFGLGGLQLGGPGGVGRLQLVDLFDNQMDGGIGNEVIYVEHIIIETGSYLDLNGLTLYYDTFENRGGTIDYNGGRLVDVNAAPIGEPAGLGLLGLALLARGRKRK